MTSPAASSRSVNAGFTSNHDLRAADDGQVKHCNGCDRTLPIEEFRFKDRSTGLRQARCVRCSAEASRRHYRRNAGQVKARSAQRSVKVRASHAATVAAARAAARCADCGASNSDRPIQFTAPDGSRRVVDASRGALSGEALRAALEAAVPLCHRCVSTRRFAKLRASVEDLAAGPTPQMLVGDAIVAALTAADRTLRFAELVTALRDSGRDDDEKVVRNTLARERSTGRVTRVERGVYRAA